MRVPLFDPKAGRLRILKRRAILLLAALAACDHVAPYAPGAYGPAGPFTPGSPRRVTYSAGKDWMPAWLPDGSGFLYSRERVDRADLDHCLAIMPGDGSPIRQELCNRGGLAIDSIDVAEAGAMAPDGRLAYVQASRPIVPPSRAPRFQSLVLGTLDTWGGRVLQSLPYFFAPTARTHEGISQVRWLGPDALVYLAERVVYQGTCFSCPTDTLRWGLEIVRVDLRAAAPVLTLLSGSDQASSVATAGSDTIYYTLNGDSRVFRYLLSRDSTTVVHDFGAGLIARDAQVAAGRLVAVVGGRVSFYVHPAWGPVQPDSGGPLVLVDLATGSEAALTDTSATHRRPALSPDGRLLVAELRIGDTSDLWLWELP